MQITPIKNNKINYTISFQRGLTPQIAKQIEQADIVEISRQIKKMNIDCDFKDNKVISWSCAKIIEIIETLNKTFNQKFALPKAIYVDDFARLNIDYSINSSETIYGLCNLTPTKLLKDTDTIIPSRVLFFNQDCPWQYIDWLSDIRFQNGETSSNFFLYTFLHDFSHSAHEDRILKRYGAKKAGEILRLATSVEFLKEYRTKFAKKVSSISQYALENPLEAVADDTSRLICDSLDENLILTRNPFINSPYANFIDYHLSRISKHSTKDKMLRNFWNGRF